MQFSNHLVNTSNTTKFLIPVQVPFPKELARRHVISDAVGLTDDPCARPDHPFPDFA